MIRPVHDGDREAMRAIINAGAQAYRGVIPSDRWREPYMAADELAAEIAAGVAFTGLEREGALAGVMGVQRVRNVSLIRHAYVVPAHQGTGVGGALLDDLRVATGGPMLVGTWAAADWAVAFYRKHGFRLVPDDAKERLLRAYWTVPERQIETSVVLADIVLDDRSAIELVARGHA